MTLTTGTLKLNSGTTLTDNIRYEIEGTTSGAYGLITASNNASPTVGSLPTGMRDFSGHSQVTSVPNAPGIVTPVWASVSGILQCKWTNNTSGGLPARTYVETNRNNAGWVSQSYVNYATTYKDVSIACGGVTTTCRVRHWNAIGYSAYSFYSAAVSVAC